jgi:hypothetical protein
VSHAAGLSGTPDCGHCWSAATSAFLRDVFGQADVTGEAREAGDDARGLDTPDGFDGAMCGVMGCLTWIASGHG